MPEQSLVGHVLGIYELVRRIGEGAGGAVYEARAREAGPAGPAGTRVAVKAVHPELVADERMLQRFQREAALGMRIRNPHLVPTYACDEETIDGVRYAWLAMAYVEGETLRETLSQLRVVPEALLHQIADQVLDALTAIHAEGMIHRDIKPENVLITPEREILVMDLGVARLQQEGRDLTHAGEFVGSLVYAAPEQFTDQDAVGPAADLYALGVVLYELATGVNPFDAPDLHGLIGQKLRGTVRRPRSWNRSLSPFFDDVILTCMRTEAEDRFASASALGQVLRDGTSGAWWARRTGGGAFDASMRALASLEVERATPLLGRSTELEVLHAAYADASPASASLLLVCGPAGVGKTRLVHDFLEELVAPDGPEVLAPGARAVPEPARAGDTGRPLVVFVDEAHEARAELVRFWQARLDAPDGRALLLCFAWRPADLEDDAPFAQALAGWRERGTARTVALQPLSPSDTRALLAEVVRVPRTVRALSGPLVRTCAGNPHFLLEALAHLKTTGALDAHTEGWEPVGPIHEVDLPQSLRGLFERRLEQLEPELLEVVEAAAVQGPAFESDLLVAVTGQRRIRLLKHLGRLERRHHLIEGVAKGRYRFTDPGLQRVVYARVEPEARRALHAACADALGASPSGARAYALVRHLLAADRMEDAAAPVVEAARHAVGSVHPSEAIPVFRALAERLPDQALAARFEAHMALSELFRLEASPDAHRRALEAAAALAAQAGDVGLAARAEAARGRAAWSAGALDEAARHAARGIELANEPASRARCAEILGLVAHRRGALEEAEAAWQAARTAWEADGRRADEARVLLMLADLPGTAGEPERPLETARRALTMLRETEEARGVGSALLAVGRALAGRGRDAEALEAFAEALSLSQERGDQPAEADVLTALARIHTAQGEWETAREELAQALDIFRALGDPGGEARALDALGMAHATFGEPEAARETLRRAADAAARTGEPALLARVYRHLGTLEHQAGQGDAAWACFEEALTHAQGHARSLVYADMGSAAERERDPDRAVELLLQSLEAAAHETDEILTRCRLARAHLAAGRWEAAQGEAERVEAKISAGGAIPPQHAPEVFFSLGSVLVTEERGRAYLERASRLVNEQVRSIKSIVSRDRFLTMRWPNPEIFDAMRRLEG